MAKNRPDSSLDSHYIKLDKHGDDLEIKSLETREKGKGWCGIMLLFLMELIRYWNKDLKIKNILLLNASFVFNKGNIAGTICYLKYIGKHFPYLKISSFPFRDNSVVYNLNKYLNLKNINWEDILRTDMNLGEVIDNNDRIYFKFMKKSDTSTIKSPSKKFTSRKSSGSSR